MHTLLDELRERAKSLGFSSLWVTDARPFDDWARAVRLRGDGFGASLQADPQAILPSARRVVVLAYPYGDRQGPDFPWVRVSPYYLASQQVHRRVPELAQWLHSRGWQAVVRPSLPAKAAALRARAGEYGQNGLILTEEHGSRVVLALLLTDAELPMRADAREASPEPGMICQGCGACVRACPVGALDGSSAVDTARCLRAHMFYDKPMPEEYRPLMGNRLLGCDICQGVCPRNISMEPSAPSAQELSIKLDALLGSSETLAQALSILSEAVGGNYARRQRMLTQAVVLAGNSGDPRYLPLIAPHCDSKNQALAEHARWAAAELRRLSQP